MCGVFDRKLYPKDGCSDRMSFVRMLKVDGEETVLEKDLAGKSVGRMTWEAIATYLPTLYASIQQVQVPE